MVSNIAPGWGLTFGSRDDSEAMRINRQLCDQPKSVEEICEGTRNDRWGSEPVTEKRAREHLRWHLQANQGRTDEHLRRRQSKTYVKGLMSPSRGYYCLPLDMKPPNAAHSDEDVVLPWVLLPVSGHEDC